MATEQYFTADVAQNGSNDKNGTSLEKWKSMSATVDLVENKPTGGFDCNICLDIVQDPVITLCGHLYCWPCIYKWIHYQSASSENLDQKQPQCPVCKAEISQETLVPLYGHGQTAKPSEGKVPHIGLVIPRRPPSPRCGVSPPRSPTTVTGQHTAQQLRHRNYAQSYYPHPSNYAAMPMTTTNVVHPTMGMFGEMVYARIFGNSETTLYTYPNTYDLVGSSSPRMRRHVMQADKSLSRLCFFLCCCMLLCLLLF